MREQPADEEGLVAGHEGARVVLKVPAEERREAGEQVQHHRRVLRHLAQLRRALLAHVALQAVRRPVLVLEPAGASVEALAAAI